MGKRHASGVAHLHDPVTAAITGGSGTAYRAEVSALEAPATGLAAGVWAAVRTQVWTRVYKDHAPAASPMGESADAWGWGPETAGPPGKSQVVRTLPYLL